MRTTITLDDHLAHRLKRRAARSGVTVSRFIQDAVRVMLNRSPGAQEASEPFKLVTFGRGGRFSRYNIDKTAHLVAAEDVERYGEPER
jgi:hypothetical protein